MFACPSMIFIAHSFNQETTRFLALTFSVFCKYRKTPITSTARIILQTKPHFPIGTSIIAKQALKGGG